MLRREAASRVRGLVDEAEERVAGRLAAVHRLECAQTEAEQDAALHPGVDAPAGGLRGVGFGGADRAGLQRMAQRVERGERVGVADGFGAERKPVLDVVLELVLRERVRHQSVSFYGARMWCDLWGGVGLAVVVRGVDGRAALALVAGALKPPTNSAHAHMRMRGCW